MQTLRNSGYPRRPHLNNCRDVCFVWYGQNIETGKETDDLSWVSFSRTRDTGKLGKSETGGLVPVLIPSQHYDKSVEMLRDEAVANPVLPKLAKSRRWVGPFLYREPLPPIPFGDSGTCVLQATTPERSAGIPLCYRVGPDLSLQLAVGCHA